MTSGAEECPAPLGSAPTDSTPASAPRETPADCKFDGGLLTTSLLPAFTPEFEAAYCAFKCRGLASMQVQAALMWTVLVVALQSVVMAVDGAPLSADPTELGRHAGFASAWPAFAAFELATWGGLLLLHWAVAAAFVRAESRGGPASLANRADAAYFGLALCHALLTPFTPDRVLELVGGTTASSAVAAAAQGSAWAASVGTWVEAVSPEWPPTSSPAAVFRPTCRGYGSGDRCYFYRASRALWPLGTEAEAEGSHVIVRIDHANDAQAPKGPRPLSELASTALQPGTNQQEGRNPEQWNTPIS